MAHRDDLREAAGALGGSVVVCGLGDHAGRLADAEFRDARYATPTDDEAAADELAVRLVVTEVRHAPPLADGEPCPRCGEPLSTYRLGASETVSCDGCGYSGIAMRHG